MVEGPQVLVHIAVLNGPNLNLLGRREPDLYGRRTLAEIEQLVGARAAKENVDLSWQQTNHEGEFVEFVHGMAGAADGALINPAAWTHTSLAIRDAFLAVPLPFVEVHLSNLFAREPDRRQSLIGDLAIGVIVGFGAGSYVLGLEALIEHIKQSNR